MPWHEVTHRKIARPKLSREAIGHQVRALLATEHDLWEAAQALSEHANVYVVGKAIQDVSAGRVPDTWTLAVQGLSREELEVYARAAGAAPEFSRIATFDDPFAPITVAAVNVVTAEMTGEVPQPQAEPHVMHQQVLNNNAGRNLNGLPAKPVNVPGIGPLAFGAHGGIQQIAESYNQKYGIPEQHPTDYTKVDPQISARIADEYERMPHAPNHPAVKSAYDDLKRETVQQYQHAIDHGYSFDFYPQGEDPYPNSPREAVLDLHHNKHMKVYPTLGEDGGYGTTDQGLTDHPLLEKVPGLEWSGRPVTYNDVFRAIHDFYGHAKEGLGFRADGEDNAWRQHAAMFTPNARRALTSETRGQNSWVNYGPHGEHNQTATHDTVYADQKAGLLPDWVMDTNLHRTAGWSREGNILDFGSGAVFVHPASAVSGDEREAVLQVQEGEAARGVSRQASVEGWSQERVRDVWSGAPEGVRGGESREGEGIERSTPTRESRDGQEGGSQLEAQGEVRNHAGAVREHERGAGRGLRDLSGDTEWFGRLPRRSLSLDGQGEGAAVQRVQPGAGQVPGRSRAGAEGTGVPSSARLTNVLDPIQETLDPDVFDRPDSEKPVVKAEHVAWVRGQVFKAMREAGWPDPTQYLDLVLTGSLTTYQWSEVSDFDVSLFIDAERFPDWVRADLIAIMIDKLDGVIVPGTTHPAQIFVVPQGVSKDDLYQPGLRSGYDLNDGKWIVVPERERVTDVQSKWPALIAYCRMVEDKMRTLLKYNKYGAKEYWHQIHDKRRTDQKAGKGDFAESNIVYKWLANANLFPDISHATGEYIAKTSMAADSHFIQQWIEKNGPYLYHGVTNRPSRGVDIPEEERVERIKREGIQPNMDGEAGPMPEPPFELAGESGWENFDDTQFGGFGDANEHGQWWRAWDEWMHHPRPNHVFMATDPVEAYGDHVFRVDLRKLDPTKVKADEDWYRDNVGWDTNLHAPHTMGQQADEMGLGNDPEHTHKSFGRGSVAYEGSIPPEAIEYMGNLRMAAAGTQTLYHITDNNQFALDPEFAPQDNTFSIEDRSGRKGVYLTADPDHWRAKGYMRPYVAEIHVPEGLAHAERWGGEQFLPAEHYDKVQVNRVVPFDVYQRERHKNTPGTLEDAVGPASTGDRDDARAFTPEEHAEHLHRVRDYLHDVHGWGWNEFDENGRHVGTDETDDEGMPVRRDRDGNVMTGGRYASSADGWRTSMAQWDEWEHRTSPDQTLRAYEPHEMSAEEFAAHPDTMWHATPAGQMGDGVIHFGTQKAAYEAMTANLAGGNARSLKWQPHQPLDELRAETADTWHKGPQDWHTEPKFIPVRVSPHHADYMIDVHDEGYPFNGGDMGDEDFPSGDAYANEQIHPKSPHGYWYQNEAEDTGSVSGVVPHKSWLWTHEDFVRDALKHRPDDVTDEALEAYPHLQGGSQ